MSGKTEAIMAEVRRQMAEAKGPMKIAIVQPDFLIRWTHDPAKDRKDPPCS